MPESPTGRQFLLRSGEQSAAVVELGGALRQHPYLTGGESGFCLGTSYRRWLHAGSTRCPSRSQFR